MLASRSIVSTPPGIAHIAPSWQRTKPSKNKCLWNKVALSNHAPAESLHAWGPGRLACRQLDCEFVRQLLAGRVDRGKFLLGFGKRGIDNRLNRIGSLR